MYLWQEPNLSVSLGHEGVTGVAPTEEVHWKISSSPSANGRLVHDPLCTIHSSCHCCLHKLQLFFSRETHRPVFRPLHQPAVDSLMSRSIGAGGDHPWGGPCWGFFPVLGDGSIPETSVLPSDVIEVSWASLKLGEQTHRQAKNIPPLL